MHLAHVEGPVYDRIEHGVGVPDKGEPEKGPPVNLRPLQEGGQGKQHVVWRPANNEGGDNENGPAQSFPFGLPE
jgi:hypothetical protein